MKEGKPFSRNQARLGILLACACGAILLLLYSVRPTLRVPSCESQVLKNYHTPITSAAAAEATSDSDSGSHDDGAVDFRNFRRTRKGSVLRGEADGCYPHEGGWGQEGAAGYASFMQNAVSPKRTEKCAEHVKAAMSKAHPFADETDPLVAVCMVGNARTLTHPGVYKRMVSNLLTPLSDRTMLFAHLKMWDTPTKEQKKHGGFRPVPVTDVSLAKAIRYLRPVSLQIERRNNNSGGHNKSYTNKGCIFSSEMAKELKQPDFYVGKYIDRFIGQMFSMFECYQSVLAFENKANITFHAIVKIRPDVTWFYPILTATELVWQRSEIVTHLADQFIFSPRKFADGFQLWWQDYAKCKGVWKAAYFPERAYEDAFKKLGATYYDDKKTPQVIRRISAERENRASAVVACGRQRRITNLTRCLELVYERDDAFI
mmetsp:Transcript_28299/g.52864  ORF Transcript_28299/g.52864 Transcript_28299/m.52864 type:complete len:430 (-) Transcript_28299:178-1467(-)